MIFAWAYEHKGEIVANILMLAWIWYLFRNHPINWLMGILNSILYAYLFIPQELYADAGLQIFEIGLCLHGWNKWISGTARNKIDISWAPWNVRIIALLIIGTLYAGQYFVLTRYTYCDVVVLDSFLTAISVAAIYLMIKRHIDNWFLWFASFIGYYFLYVYKHFYVTAATQFVLFAMSLLGFMFWLNDIEDQKLMAWTDQV